MIYDELIKNLRHDSASALQNCEFDFVHAWMLEATDAIEDLQKQLDNAEIENIKLKEEFAKYRAKRQWIPVTERLPESRGHYFVHVDGGEFEFVSYGTLAYFDGKIFRWGHFSNENWEEVTHWMPLPEPPKDGEA